MAAQTVPTLPSSGLTSVADAQLYNQATRDVLDRLVYDIIKLRNSVDALVTSYNNHTHRGDGAQSGQYNTSKPQSDTQTISQSTAVSLSAPSTVTTTA